MNTEYQFLHFNTAGVIDSAERLRLAGDEDALARARAAVADARIEVWRGGQRIAVVPPALFSGAAGASGRRRRLP
jgi:hypothetical protein